MSSPIRFLSGLPLMVMAAALLVLGLQRLAPHGQAAKPLFPGEMLIADGRPDAATAWYGVLAGNDDPAALRRFAAAADLADMPGTRATALQRLVRTGKATLAEHLEAARLLAWAGAQPEALTVLFNAERRFPASIDLPFLSFYAALAHDCHRPEIAAAAARALWQRTGNDDALKLMIELSGDDAGAPH